MHIKTRLAIYITLLLVLFALAAPAFSQELPPVLRNPDLRFEHDIIYDIGGKISINRQLGDKHSTGAVKRTKVSGYGEMSKVEEVRMAFGIIKVSEKSHWSVPKNALSGLAVTTTIDLCCKPMAVAAAVYNDPNGNFTINEGDLINVYDPLVVSGDLPVKYLTDQLWAIRQVVDPGHQGEYRSDFIAACGPGPYEEFGLADEYGDLLLIDEKYMWKYDPLVEAGKRDDKRLGYERGDYYVGNYFDIEQYALVTGGIMHRYISMSNPFENSLFMEESYVTGRMSVQEVFSNHGLKGGPKAITLAWYELF